MKEWVFTSCRACKKNSVVEGKKLCQSCDAKIQAEIDELETEDAAVNALADAADQAELDCWRNKPQHPGELRLPNDAFIEVVYQGIDAGITDWEIWAKTVGLDALRKAMQDAG